MIHLSFAQVFEIADSSKVTTLKRPINPPMPSRASSKASLNMFDFSPSVANHRPAMQQPLCLAGGQVIMNRTLPGGRMS
jgi:hypothetical protein